MFASVEGKWSHCETLRDTDDVLHPWDGDMCARDTDTQCSAPAFVVSDGAVHRQQRPLPDPQPRRGARTKIEIRLMVSPCVSLDRVRDFIHSTWPSVASRKFRNLSPVSGFVRKSAIRANCRLYKMAGVL